jgi:hypothetical protein
VGEREGTGDPEVARVTGRETAWLVIAWLVVGIPAAWGVWQVLARSLALFRR